MFFYIFECMMYVLPPLYGLGDPLISTNEIATVKDIFVGWVGWVIIVLLILGISLIITYISKSKAKKLDSADSECNKEIKENNTNLKFVRRLFYFLECLALCFLCLHGGVNRPMRSTHNKATYKEVIVSFVGWIIIILLTLLILLLCVVF